MTGKTCLNCKKSKPPVSFSKRALSKDGLQQWCRECTAEWRSLDPKRIRANHAKSMVKYMAKYRIECRDKVRARSAVSRALKSGALAKGETCERCDSPARDAHHADYSKPLEVEWLCRPCHVSEHHHG